MFSVITLRIFNILAQNQDVSDICLDFTSFLLRYNRDLDYQDFSDEPAIIQKIKRAETYRTWADIEDLGTQNNLNQAVQELFTNFDMFRKEEMGKKNDLQKDVAKLNKDLQRLREYQQPQPQQKQKNNVDSLAALEMINEVKTAMTKLIENKIIDLEFNLNNKIITRIENIERNSEIHLRTAQNLENRHTIDQRRMEKLEETMTDQINIIESMSRRQKSFIESQDENKKNIMVRLQRIETDLITKAFEALDSKLDFESFEQSIRKLQGDIDVFRVEHLTFKEIASGKLDNIDVIFKKVANDSFNKVREVESALLILRDEFLKITEESIKDSQEVHNKLESMVNEVSEIKNERRALTNLKQKVHWASDASAKVEALVEETNNLYTFLQKFIDEHGVSKIKKLRSQDVNLKEKMNIMDWVARNSEFLTAQPIQESIAAFKELYNTENATLKNAYIFAKHSSNVIQTICVILKQLSSQAKDEENQQKLSIIYSILEPLLINDQNLEKCLMQEGLNEMLNSIQGGTAIVDKPPVYVKYCIRCITSCLRHEQGVHIALNNEHFIEVMIQILRVVRDEEILANVSKSFRICLRDDQNMDYVVAKRKDIGNILIETLKKYLKIIISVARTSKNERIRSVAIQVLKNCCKVADYERFLAQENALEMALAVAGKQQY
eukprot:403330738